MVPWSALRMITLLVLGIFFTWIWDLCHCRWPRSLDDFGPRWCERHSQIVMDCEWDNKVREKTLPVPLAKKRKRALTDPKELRKWQSIAWQSKAPLLSKLPIELRHMTYMSLLRGLISTLQVNQKMYNQFLRSIGVPNECYSDCWTCYRTLHISLSSKCYTAYTYTKFCSSQLTDPFDACPQTNFLPLLLSCRQVYAEGIGALYSSYTFRICEPRILSLFASTILPERLNLFERCTLYKRFHF